MKGCLFVLVGIVVGVLVVLVLLIALKPKAKFSKEVPAGTPDVEVTLYETYLNQQLSAALASQFSGYVDSSSLDVKPNREILVTIQARVPKGLGKGIIGSIMGIVSQVQGGKVTLQIDSRISVSGKKVLVKVESIKLGKLPVQRGMLGGPLGQMLESGEKQIDSQINSQIAQTGLVPYGVESDERSLTIFLKAKAR